MFIQPYSSRDYLLQELMGMGMGEIGIPTMQKQAVAMRAVPTTTVPTAAAVNMPASKPAAAEKAIIEPAMDSLLETEQNKPSEQSKVKKPVKKEKPKVENVPCGTSSMLFQSDGQRIQPNSQIPSQAAAKEEAKSSQAPAEEPKSSDPKPGPTLPEEPKLGKEITLPDQPKSKVSEVDPAAVVDKLQKDASFGTPLRQGQGRGILHIDGNTVKLYKTMSEFHKATGHRIRNMEESGSLRRL